MEEKKAWDQTEDVDVMVRSTEEEPKTNSNQRDYKLTSQENNSAPDMPEPSVPVVKVLSVRGLEYLMMSISLWLGAGGLLWGILTVVNGGTSFDILAMPASLALVGVAIFAGFFVRLKRAELKDPSLRLDASKRRSSQITQLAAFLVLVFNLIAFVYIAFSILGGKSTTSIGKAAINLLVVTAIAGGILAYYWFDEHREQKRG